MTENLIAPERYNMASEFERYRNDEQRVALRCCDADGSIHSLTYAQLLREANRAGNALLSFGLRKGDRVLLMLPRSVAAYQLYIAALKLGLVIVPCSELLRASELEYRIEHSGASALICDYRLCDAAQGLSVNTDISRVVSGGECPGWLNLDQRMQSQSTELALSDTQSEDMAFLSYTSGTTGYPKGVVHSHAWGFAHLRTAAPNWLDIREEDIVWATAGPGWAKWLWSPFLSVLGSGACGFFYTGKFDPDTYLRLIQDQKISVLCCTPTEYRIMAKSDSLPSYDLASLRSAVSAGEPLNVEVIDTFARHFQVQVRDGYGQTENTLLVGTLKDMAIRPGSMGKPTPGNSVTLLDEDGREVPHGETGDIAVHLETPALFRHYYNDPDQTRASRRGNYYLTGDRARCDSDGYFWFEGRSDDIIISAGYTIGPFEVEDAMVKHPAVKECAVIAKADPTRGAIVKAFVTLKGEIPDDCAELIKRLQDHVKKFTAPYKYPREIEFLEELPKTTSGKIRRVVLREREQQQAAG